MNSSSKLSVEAILNDEFRQQCMLISVFSAVLQLKNVSELVATVQVYNNFNGDNDPRGEHDFGSLVFDGQKIYWMIDCYGDYVCAHNDTLDMQCRVLTIMIADEY